MNESCAVRTHGAGRRLPVLPGIVRLCGVAGVPHHVLRRAGAEAGEGFWTVDVSARCDHLFLASFLPRSAGGTAGGEVCGHAPPGHAADLVNSLCSTSWRVLSEVTCLRIGACVECGDRPGPAASPSWSWSDDGPEVVGTLLTMRPLCVRCLPCERPGDSSWRWPKDKRIARIAAIARIDFESASDRVVLHSERMSGWTDIPSVLDVTILSGLGLRFRKGWSRQGDRLVSEAGSSRIVGAMLSDSRGMVEIV